MTVFDRLHCPACQGRLGAGSDSGSTETRGCTVCLRVFPVSGGIVDLGGDADADRLPAGRFADGAFWSVSGVAGLLVRMQTAVGERWPAVPGDTILPGCAQGDVAEAIVASGTVRSLLVLDTAMDRLHACRMRLSGAIPEDIVTYAAVGDFGGVIRDAVADTVICPGLLSSVAEPRDVLAMVYRVLKPGGRAAFVVPNRRYWQAICTAMAEAMVQLHAKERIWPEGQAVVMEVVAHTRRLLLHRDDAGFLAGLREKHLFDAETLQDWGREIGFATAEAIPLDSDPDGAATTRRICRDAGAPDSFTEPFGALVAAVGQTYFDLLGRQDSSASMVLWLTKAPGPRSRIFTALSEPPSTAFAGPDAAVGGAEPRWSVELLARDTPDGIVVAVGGWCLCNMPVRWIRLTLDGMAQHAPVWRPRPDVHEVLNGRGLYKAMSAICSGLDSELVFAGIHAVDNVCAFRLEVVLENGVTVTGTAPEALVLNEQMVVAH